MSRQKTETIYVKGMFCTNCETRVQKSLLELPGVSAAHASFAEEAVRVTFDADQVSPGALKTAIENVGYETVAKSGRTLQIVSVLIILLAFYVIADHFGWTQVFRVFPQIEETFSLGLLFTTGLLTSVHCIAMCGGINLTQSTSAVKNGGSIAMSNFAYNAGRVISYTAIGGVVGGIGSVLSFRGSLRGVITVAVGAIMIVMALSMLGVFRPLRRLPLHLPAGIYQKLAAVPRERSSFLVGLLNGFMPCGPLQSMQLYALSAGSAAKGALSMLLFSLGTVPLMLGFGLFSGKLNRKYARYMLTVSALLIFLMGLHMAGNGFSLTGISIGQGGTNGVAAVADRAEEIQRVTTEVDYGSYEVVRVRAGIPVEWTIVVPEGRLNGCNSVIVVPEYDLTIELSEGENVVTFLPEEPGTVPYTCWMGMIKSSIEVVG